MIYRIINNYRDARRSQIYYKEEKHLILKDFPQLTKEEFAEVQRTWPFIHWRERDLTWYRIYKNFHGFSPYVMGGIYSDNKVREIVNPFSQLSSLEHKGLCDVYFPTLPFPKALVRRISGIYYDSEMNQISELDAATILAGEEQFVIKPAWGTFQGKGVRKISCGTMSGIHTRQISELFKDYTCDIIAQEVVCQHHDVEELNPTSLNCCRVTSIYINGKYDYSVMLKIGKKGSSIDNWNSSLICGVSKDGIIQKVGYDNKLNVYEATDRGVVFGGRRLPRFKEMVTLVEQSHKHFFPNCGIIGWDVFVDNENKVRLIEANLTVPGLVGEMLAAGCDFLKPFRDDICEKAAMR